MDRAVALGACRGNINMWTCPKFQQNVQYVEAAQRKKVDRYPDNAQLNTSFPILMRTSPTSNMPAVPFSCEPSSAFNAGTMFSGRRGILGNELVFSLAGSRTSVAVESVSRLGGSGAWADRPCV